MAAWNHIGRVLGNVKPSAASIAESTAELIRRRGKNRKETARALRSLFEALEDRTLFAVLPAPDVTSTAVIASNGNAGTLSSPSVAYDPLNPNFIVQVAVEHGANTWQHFSGTNQTDFIAGDYSKDGGKTWTAFYVPSFDLDPIREAANSPNPEFAQATDPTVQFDRLHNFYVSFSLHAPDYASGYLALDKFNVDQTTLAPSVDLNVNPYDGFAVDVNGIFLLNQPKALHIWDNNPPPQFMPIDYDAAYTPTMVVDSNPYQYTDPTTNKTWTDSTVDSTTGQGHIYIAYTNVEASWPNLPSGALVENPNEIVALESDDGGLSFGPTSVVNENGLNAVTGKFPGREATPRMVISQGSFNVNGTVKVPAGQVTLVWDDFKNNIIYSKALTSSTAQGFSAGANTQILDGQAYSAPAVQNVSGAFTSVSVAAAQATNSVDVSDAVTADPNSTAVPQAADSTPTSFFDSNFIGLPANYFEGFAIVFTSLNPIQQAIVTKFDNTTGQITFSPALNNAPAIGDTFDLIAIDLTDALSIDNNGDLQLTRDLGSVAGDATGLVQNMPGITGPNAPVFTTDPVDFGTVIQGTTVTTMTTGLFNTTNAGFFGPEPDVLALTDAGVEYIQNDGFGIYAGSNVVLPIANLPAGANLISVVVDDFDGDGNLDFAVTDDQGNVYVMLGNGDGSFQPETTFSGSMSGTTAIQAVDVGGGNVALAIAGTDSSGNDGVQLLLNDGNGDFSTVGSFLTTSFQARDLTANDFNGDGIPDLAVLDGRGQVDIYIGSGGLGTYDATFQQSYALTDRGERITSGDFYSLGQSNAANDIAVSSAFDNSVTFLVNHGDATFEDPTTITSSVADAFAPTQLIPVDLNFTGGTDLVMAHSGAFSPSTAVGVLTLDEASTPTQISFDTSSLPAGFTISDVTLELGLLHPDDSELMITLTAPNGYGTVTLVNSNSLKGQNLGVWQTQFGDFYDPTIFDDNGSQVFTPNSQAWFPGEWVPQGNAGLFFNLPDLTSFNGLTGAQIGGTWTLTIYDSKLDNTGANPQLVDNAVLHLGDTVTAAQKKVGSTALTGYYTGVPAQASGIPGIGAGLVPAASPISGVGPTPVIASDNTLGSFSPHQGRLYVSYVTVQANHPADDTDIALFYSDDGGATWTAGAANQPTAGIVNDDKASTDGFSEASGAQGRPQFLPSIAVDPTTGTLVETFYDARQDASRVRVQQTIATSIDGGATFAPETYLNAASTATDAITGKTVTLGPIPDNGAHDEDSTHGFGTQEGLAVYGGSVHAVWAGNQNGGPTGGTAQQVLTAVASITSGPRLLSGSMGQVTNQSSYVLLNGHTTQYYNNTFAQDGTRQITGMVVYFDRPIDQSTFDTSLITLVYTDVNGNQTIISGPQISKNIFGAAIALYDESSNLDSASQQKYGASKYFIPIANASDYLSNVGTYSYYVAPNLQSAISDRVRAATANRNYNSGLVNVAIPDASFVKTGLPDTPGADIGGTAGTVITVSNATANEQILTGSVTFTIDHANTGDLDMWLTDPNGNKYTLETKSASKQSPGKVDFTNVTVSLGTQLYNPASPLPINGDWTLHVVDNYSKDSGTLVAWSLDLQTIDPSLSVTGGQTGNAIDQNGDGVGGQQAVTSSTAGDVFAVPGPSSNTAFNGSTFGKGAFTGDTLPLIIPGPHILSSVSYTTGTLSFSGTASADGTTSTLIDTAVPNTNQWNTVDFWKGFTVNFTSGLNTGLSAAITGYDPVSHTITFAALPSQVLTGDAFTINFPIADAATTASGQLDTPGSATTNTIDLTGNVDPTALIKHLSVTVNITHGNVGDLDLTLIAPDGTRIPLLFSFVTKTSAPAGSDLLQVTFDDLATGNLTSSAVAPYTGTYAPDSYTQPVAGTSNGSGGLEYLVGKQLSGQWRLEVVDDISDATDTTIGRGTNGNATLDSWSINAETQQLAVNGTISSFHITFDRDMNAASFIDSGTHSSIVNMLGPAEAGALAGATITADPNFGGFYSDSSQGYGDRTFLVSFPAQQLDGSYALTVNSTETDTKGNQIDSNLDAGLDVLRGSSPTGTTTVSYASTGSAVTIGSTTAVTSTISVPTGTNLTNVRVTLSITYSNDPDLTALLIGPDGTTVTLFSGVGANGSHSNFSNTVFTDGSPSQTLPTPITSGQAPFLGQYAIQDPQQLKIFTTNQSNQHETVPGSGLGTWTLEIIGKNLNTGKLNSWSLAFDQPTFSTGEGTVADQSQIDFRVFTTDPANPLSRTVWNAIGGGSTTTPGSQQQNDQAGSISAIAVDPSDPSGNTVYAAGSSGGVWKTTNFLTTDAAGPNWVPLTDFGPTTSLSVGSIAVFGRNKDPKQSILIAGTGDPNVAMTDGNFIPNYTAAGVGFLISKDGGTTWNLYDSSDNTKPFAQRDHIFSGSTVFKVVVDPRLASDNTNVILYAAVTDTTGKGHGGIWRSTDSGLHWTQVKAGNATDVTLDLNSGTFNAVSNPTGNVQIIYGAFANDGIYSSPDRGSTWNKMLGNIGDPLIRNNFNVSPAQSLTVASPRTNPFGNVGRITLSKPALTGNPLKDVQYQGWLYALVATPDGSFQGLYLTKDFGQNWTRIDISSALGTPTNDSTNPDQNIFGGAPYTNTGNYDMSLAVDPTNPSIIYIGGTNHGPSDAFLRVDVSKLSDAHSFYLAQDRNDGASLRVASQDGAPLVPVNGVLNGNNGARNSYNSPFLNLLREPTNPFLANATVLVQDVNGFANTGAGATWTTFNIGNDIKLDNHDQHAVLTMVDPLTGRARLIVATDQGIFTGVDSAGTFLKNIDESQVVYGARNGDIQVAQLYAGAVEPSALAAQVAGALFYGVGQSGGISTSGATTLSTGLTSETGTIGNGAFVAVNEAFTGSTGAASANGTTTTVSDTNATSSAWGINHYWEGFSITFTTGANAGQTATVTGYNSNTQTLTFSPALSNAVAVNDDFTLIPSTAATHLYQFILPSSELYGNAYGSFGSTTDFFQVNGASRTFGLLQSISGDNYTPDPQWPFLPQANTTSVGIVNSAFAVNPIDGDQMIISSNDGRLFGTTNQGVFWSVIGDLNVAGSPFDSSYKSALAYGAPDTVGSGGSDATNFFLYAGSVAGNVFVTFTGGGASGNQWISLGSPDGSPIMSIVPSTLRGSHQVYVATQKGVYFMADSSAANPQWTNITNGLFSIQNPAPFGQSSLVSNKLTQVMSLTADWRYALPDDFANPTGPSHPVLYLSGDGGVFRSVDKGKTWTIFPDDSIDGATTAGSAVGGYLPNVAVTDLDLSVGNIDPTTGQPDLQSNDPDLLLASTYGRGQYSITVAPVIAPGSARVASFTGSTSNSTLIPGDPNNQAWNYDVNNPLTVAGYSEQSAFGNAVRITLYDMDSGTPVYISGFDGTMGDGSDVSANWTDTTGYFNVVVPNGTFTSGTHTIGVQATDDAGAIGAMTTFQFEQDDTVPAITISPNPVTTDGNNQTITEGKAFTNAVLATFTDIHPYGTAQIDWGDGQPIRAGTIVANSGTSYSILGSYTYAEDGTYNVTITLTDAAGNTTVQSIQLTVADPSVVATGGLTFNATEGSAAANQTIATFTDPAGSEPLINPTTNLPNYTATIDWGDNTVTTSGVITYDATTDTFSVAGGHTYTEDGNYTINVTINHGTSAAVAVNSTAAVADVPLQMNNTSFFSGQEGQSSGLVQLVKFTDPAGAEVVGNYTATINWGDNNIDNSKTNPTAVSILPDPNVTNGFIVFGSHAYVGEGSYTITISVAHGTAAAGVATTTASVTDPQVVAGTPLTISTGVTENTAFTNLTIATFTDPGGAELTPSIGSNYNVTIDWNDGSPLDNTGVITYNAKTQTFSVSGSHKYTEEGTYLVAITLKHASTAAVLTGATIKVIDPSVIATGGFTYSGTEAINTVVVNNQPVATFTDPAGAEAIGDYTANIDWGDGTATLNAPITYNAANNRFTVSGFHGAYAVGGKYNIVTTIIHDASTPVTATSTANITDPSVTVVPPQGGGFYAVSGNEGAPTSGGALTTLATFTDSGFDHSVEAATDPNWIYDNYTVVVSWGDGNTDTSSATSQALQISYDSTSKVFKVTGVHTYSEEAVYTAGITLKHDAAANVTTHANVTIADVPVSATNAAPLTSPQNTSTGQIVLASFTDPGDPNHSEGVASFSADINWGDGTSGLGSIVWDSNNSRYNVLGVHTYTDAVGKDENVSVTIHHETAADQTAGTIIHITAAPIKLTNDKFTFTATEGVNSSKQTVASFTDSGVAVTSPQSAIDSTYSAVISWGDGTTSNSGPGDILWDSVNKKFIVTASHKYTEDGAYTVSTVITRSGQNGDPGPAAITFKNTTATVADQAVNATGLATTISNVFTRLPFTGLVVATFTDPAGAEGVGNYTASINWGDGTSTSAGTITVNSGTFSVAGGHTYATDGTYTITTTVTHGGLTSTATSTAKLTAQPVNATAAADISGTEAKPTGTVTLATFTDPAGAELPVASHYGATINWGDGSTATAGTISPPDNNGVFTITSSAGHTYTFAGNYTITVTITHDSAPAVPVTLHANIADIAVVATGGFNFLATENAQSTRQIVATFTDPDGARTSPSIGSWYGATINWGDGNTTTVNPATDITFDVNTKTFSVFGQHTYTDEGTGTYTVTTTITHNASLNGGVTSTATSNANVADPQVVVIGTAPLQGVRGTNTTFQAIAFFTDPAGSENVVNYDAVVDFGDGTIVDTRTQNSGDVKIKYDADGSVTGTPDSFYVYAQHTYTTTGNTPINVTIYHPHLATSGVQTTTSAHISGNALTSVLTTGAISANEGQALTNVPIATFTDPVGADLANYQATIFWHDGTAPSVVTSTPSTSGVIVADPNNGNVFIVKGTHTYSEENQYTATVQLTNAGVAATNTADTTVNVAEVPVVVGGGVTFSATEGASASGLVATFTDPAGAEDPKQEYSASINWGDGSSSAADTITYNAGTGQFSVFGTHLYQHAGNYPITTTVLHDGLFSDNSAQKSSGKVGNAAITSVQMVNFVPLEGTAFTGTIATFTSASIFANPSDFSIAVNWGDGTGPQTATVQATSTPGVFSVVGTHTYADGPNGFTMTVTVGDGSVFAGSSQRINVSDVPPTVSIVTSPVRFDGATTFTIGATDPSGADTFAGFNYRIDFGDGSTPMVISASQSNGGAFNVTHTYPNGANYNVTVTATDKDGVTGTATASSLGTQAADLVPVQNLAINGGSSNASFVKTIDLTLVTPGITSDITRDNLTLLRNGKEVIDLRGASLSYSTTTGAFHLDVSNLGLADGNYQLQISRGSAGVIPVNFSKLAGDINGDGIVDKKDLALVKANVGSSSTNFDVNGDGLVDSADVSLVKKFQKHRTASTTKSIVLNVGKGTSKPKLDFGSMKLGQATGPIDVVLSNADSSQPLQIQDVKITGNSAVYDVELTSGAWGSIPSQLVIPAGQTLTLRVFVNPIRTGKQTAALSFIYSRNDHSLFNFATLPLSSKIS